MYNIINKFRDNIFRGYDIRGESDIELSEDLYYTLGRAYAKFLSQRRIKESIVGRDNRLTSLDYSKAFIQGLNDSGINTIDLGLSLSQIVYFACYEFKTKGSTMVTASHNPKQYNGLKLGVGYSETMLSSEIQLLKKFVSESDFCQGAGTNIEIDIFPNYQKEILKYFNINKKWKVVVDCSNSVSGLFYPRIFESAGFEVIPQHCELDGHFPLGVPDPTEHYVLKRLADGVLKYNADIGFAYDADGDRMAAVDERGRVLWMDTIVALFALDVIDFIPGASIVYNALCSKQVTEAISLAGGKSIIWKTGHSFIKSKIREIRAPFGGELSGHIFFSDNFFGHDDAAYASLRLLNYLERKGRSLAESVDSLPQYFSSPEIKLGLSDEIKFEFIDRSIKQDFYSNWPNAKYTDIDGIRMDTEDSMVIIRASHNGPYITIKFESKSRTKYNALKKTVLSLLMKYDEIDWNNGVNTHAFKENS